MCKKILSNGIKLIYEFRAGAISSFSVAFDAGSNAEAENELGLAHIVEHMLFKGTVKRNEFDINRDCDRIFGFNNAMTNYPYAVYYGTSLNEDLEKGIELYSDILLNPAFPEAGFKEEIQIICEELKEWKDDTYQALEDSMLFNAFNKLRIKNLIIGNEKSIKSYLLSDVIRFYKEHYCPENCVVSVVTSMEYQSIFDIVNKYFGTWESKEPTRAGVVYEGNKAGIYVEQKPGLEGCKVMYCFQIQDLSEQEIILLRLFNCGFGEGSSSVLFDEVRTQRGLAYDVTSFIKNEKGIKLFIIKLGTSEENLEKALDTVDKCILKIKDLNDFTSLFNENTIREYKRMYRLRQELKYEKSIILSNALSTYEIMYDNSDLVFKELNEMDLVEPLDIYNTIIKIFKEPTVQIFKPL